MKKLILFAIPLLLLGCRANFPVAQQSGKEDLAYLLFVSSQENKNATIDVVLDNETPFEARVVSKKKSNRRGTQYAVRTGTRSIKVSRQGTTLYQKQIFLSPQEVKQIVLP